MNRLLIIIIIVTLLQQSCSNRQKSDNIYCEKSLTEIQKIAEDGNVPFCLILFDSTQVISRKHIVKFYSKDQKLNHVVFNLVNITFDENKWYEKLLSPQVLPLNCVFAASGELIDLIPGSTKESLLYTKKVLSRQKANKEFHYNQKYDSDKIEAIKIIDIILQLKFRVDNNENVIAELDTILNKARYPYTLFLKLQNQLQYRDSIAAKNTAKELLQFNSARDLLDYHDELMFARQILDPTFNIETGPYIDISPTEIELTNCEINNSIRITINIKNKGQKPLKITDILKSCSCVKLISKKKHSILPQQSIELDIEFTPEETGDIYREVYIASNSVNSPISNIKINASVQ